jgi:hypothetical protein
VLETLTERLSRVVKTLRGEARLTDQNIQDALREVRLALLEADVALPVVKTFVNDLRDKAIGAEVVGSLTPGQALIGVVARELTALMGGAAQPLDLAMHIAAGLGLDHRWKGVGEGLYSHDIEVAGARMQLQAATVTQNRFAARLHDVDSPRLRGYTVITFDSSGTWLG